MQKGMGFHVLTAPPDTTSPDLDLHRLAGVPLDIPATEHLVWETYRYAGLLQRERGPFESTSAMAASSLATPVIQLAYVYAGRSDTARAERAIDRAARLSSNPGIRTALEGILFPADTSSP